MASYAQYFVVLSCLLWGERDTHTFPSGVLGPEPIVWLYLWLEFILADTKHFAGLSATSILTTQ